MILLAHLFRSVPALVVTITVSVTAAAEQSAVQELAVPVAGNAFRSAPDPFAPARRRDEILQWNATNDVYSIYFHVDRAAEATLLLDARSMAGTASLQATVNGKTFDTVVDSAEFRAVELGSISVEKPGYVRVDLKGTKTTGTSFGEIRALIVRCSSRDVKITCVATNEGNMFYWGRRGPSVHLSYNVPKTDIEYGYSEITVSEGDDPVGSYFMANGFAEGYFGIQVNSEQERRVLFSVWSPYSTDNPAEIPQDQRVELLGKGPDVRSGEFGNEGSGGQSYLVYPWKAGRTYRFLTQVKPGSDDRTTYTCWFGDKQNNEWRLIASFRRPKTNTHLKGFHSFLENFNPQTGHLSRRGQHQNVWVRDTQGKWFEILSARFSVDATGGGGHRLDFTGGADGNSFYLRNCGFFAESEKPGTVFERESSSVDGPAIEFDRLPGISQK
ncbi:MAG: DUF3472 domain-containing protein [Planctomycetota bacterium]